ncbi:winged helix-turn-helix transcriptional regulator [Anaerotignum sp.]|uniref:winged helix-turn-helix transcriptional regulator n=1 Tax=Anaerotignum sp. TaxID=2039241 RepID=UPI002ED584F9
MKKIDKAIHCLLEYGLEIFGGKWKPRIICVLNEKKILRYSEIRKEMMNVTDAVLALVLKVLIRDEIVQRKSYDEIPSRVKYRLTKRGTYCSNLTEHLRLVRNFL